MATAVCVPLTSNLRRAAAPGNVLLDAAITGLPKDSVANATQIVALDRGLLEPRTGRISSVKLNLLLASIDTVRGQWTRSRRTKASRSSTPVPDQIIINPNQLRQERHRIRHCPWEQHAREQDRRRNARLR